MIKESEINCTKMLIFAFIEVLVLFFVMIFVHEFGHWIIYGILHDDVATFHISPVGFSVRYVAATEFYAELIAWGGFLATLIFIPFFKKYNTIGKIVVYVIVLYGFIEGIVQAWKYPNGIEILATTSIVVIYIPLLIGVIIWAKYY